ncbi:MAG: glycosyltransferase [Leptolyngbyaceae cyanobacterium CSU_1_3]|nr:glycosyltransferase [Leptolyngbyaceae cyanobacterium CSU_1_3]
MLFELSVGGHYPGYIQHLVRHWRERQLSGHLDVIVSPQFLEQHGDVVEEAGDRSEIRFRAIAPQEDAALSSRSSGRTRAIRSFQEWQLIRQYATLLKADHCLIPYFDTRQLPLALGATLPCSFSGIYFRPTFHYPTFEEYVGSSKDWIQRSREKFLLGRVLANPQLQTLFCLDPFVLKHLDQFHTSTKAVYLPDPVQIYSHSPEITAHLKVELGIEAHRKVFLLFGALDGRKGIQQLLTATATLSPENCQKLCLLLVGPIDPQEKPSIDSQIAEIQRSRPVQILHVNRFVIDREIQPYFQLSDVILAPYQRHVGMSAILVRAAAAQKPVLSSNYGLMGEMTRRHQLGLAIDSTDPQAIADGISFLLQTSSAQVGDRSKMQAFAAQNSAQRFADVIFETIWTG